MPFVERKIRTNLSASAFESEDAEADKKREEKTKRVPGVPQERCQPEHVQGRGLRQILLFKIGDYANFSFQQQL